MSRSLLCFGFLTSYLFWCSHAVEPVFAEGVALESELDKLESLRQGRKVPFGVVEVRGRELLKRFPAPKEQGQIYYRLAHIYAQSGLTQPDKVVEYAQQALKYPLDPSQKLTLYVYVGDARQVDDAQEPFPAKRAKAVMSYLEGLKEAQQQHLPAKAPQSPPVGASDISPSDPDYAEYQREHDAAIRAWELARSQMKGVGLRDILFKQIVELYTRPPYATEELETKAMQVLEDRESVDRLLESVRAKIPPSTQNEKPLPVSSGWSSWVIVGLGILVALSVLALLYLRRRGAA